MTAEPLTDAQHDDEVAAFVHDLIETAAQQRLPDLFGAAHADALYRIPDRGGVSVVVLRTTSLTEEQLIKLMRFRLAQYLAVNFIDSRMVYDARMAHEPLSGVQPSDVHVIAGSVATGEILCYAAIKAGPDAPPNTTLREHDRPAFPVEKIHGWGIYNRLRLLPDLPVSKLRELGRFVKNQRLRTFDELSARGPVEVGVALFRTLAGPLRLEVEALIGDLEEGVAKQNLEFFHVPMVVIHGTVPYEAEASYFFPRYQFCTVYPFAALSSDISRAMLSRLDAIEQALAQPGKAGLLALFALKKVLATPRSALEPPEGLAELVDTRLPQEGVAMHERRQMLDMADRLRTTNLFGGLSVAEATVLGTFMERSTVKIGEVIVRQGDAGDDLFLIESGQAEVRVTGRDGLPIKVAMLGPGDYFGEIALITGEERIADVVAVTPMALLRLTRDAYARYLNHAAEIEQQLTRTAMSRTRDTTRRLIAGDR